jgi:hypothetical protein
MQCEHAMRTTLIEYTQDHPSPACMQRNTPRKQNKEYLIPLTNPSLPKQPPFGVAVRCGCVVHAQMQAFCDGCRLRSPSPSATTPGRSSSSPSARSSPSAAQSQSASPHQSDHKHTGLTGVAAAVGSYKFTHRVPTAELRRCFQCGGVARSRCAKCHQARYCSRECTVNFFFFLVCGGFVVVVVVLLLLSVGLLL